MQLTDIHVNGEQSVSWAVQQEAEQLIIIQS